MPSSRLHPSLASSSHLRPLPNAQHQILIHQVPSHPPPLRSPIATHTGGEVAVTRAAAPKSPVALPPFANCHAFSHLPTWVTVERQNRRALDHAERAGVVALPFPYSCAVCGHRFPTHPDFARQFRQLRQRERFISSNTKYDEAAHELLTPKVRYGLASDLRRAGVHIRIVPDKPQVADHALKCQVKHFVACGVDWVMLVSDDFGFTDTVHKARAANLRTVVVGDGCRMLGNVVDIWLPWDRVENGEVDEEMLRSGMWPEFGDEEGDEQDEEFVVDWDMSELDDVVDDIVATRTKLFGATTMSAFADEDIVDGVLGLGLNRDDMFWSSDNEDEDGYLFGVATMRMRMVICKVLMDWQVNNWIYTQTELLQSCVQSS